MSVCFLYFEFLKLSYHQEKQPRHPLHGSRRQFFFLSSITINKSKPLTPASIRRNRYKTCCCDDIASASEKHGMNMNVPTMQDKSETLFDNTSSVER